MIFGCIIPRTKFTECRTIFPHQIYYSYKLTEKIKLPFSKTACKCAILMEGVFYKHQNQNYTCDMPYVKYDFTQINFVMPHLSSVQFAVKRSPCRTMSGGSHKNYYKHQK